MATYFIGKFSLPYVRKRKKSASQVKKFAKRVDHDVKNRDAVAVLVAVYTVCT